MSQLISHDDSMNEINYAGLYPHALNYDYDDKKDLAAAVRNYRRKQKYCKNISESKNIALIETVERKQKIDEACCLLANKTSAKEWANFFDGKLTEIDTVFKYDTFDLFIKYSKGKNLEKISFTTSTLHNFWDVIGPLATNFSTTLKELSFAMWRANLDDVFLVLKQFPLLTKLKIVGKLVCDNIDEVKLHEKLEFLKDRSIEVSLFDKKELTTLYKYKALKFHLNMPTYAMFLKSNMAYNSGNDEPTNSIEEVCKMLANKTNASEWANFFDGKLTALDTVFNRDTFDLFIKYSKGKNLEKISFTTGALEDNFWGVIVPLAENFATTLKELTFDMWIVKPGDILLARKLFPFITTMKVDNKVSCDYSIEEVCKMLDYKTDTREWADFFSGKTRVLHTMFKNGAMFNLFIKYSKGKKLEKFGCDDLNFNFWQVITPLAENFSTSLTELGLKILEFNLVDVLKLLKMFPLLTKLRLDGNLICGDSKDVEELLEDLKGRSIDLYLFKLNEHTPKLYVYHDIVFSLKGDLNSCFLDAYCIDKKKAWVGIDYDEKSVYTDLAKSLFSETKADYFPINNSLPNSNEVETCRVHSSLLGCLSLSPCSCKKIEQEEKMSDKIVSFTDDTVNAKFNSLSNFAVFCYSFCFCDFFFEKKKMHMTIDNSITIDDLLTCFGENKENFINIDTFELVSPVEFDITSLGSFIDLFPSLRYFKLYGRFKMEGNLNWLADSNKKLVIDLSKTTVINWEQNFDESKRVKFILGNSVHANVLRFIEPETPPEKMNENALDNTVAIDLDVVDSETLVSMSPASENAMPDQIAVDEVDAQMVNTVMPLLTSIIMIVSHILLFVPRATFDQLVVMFKKILRVVKLTTVFATRVKRALVWNRTQLENPINPAADMLGTKNEAQVEETD